MFLRGFFIGVKSYDETKMAMKRYSKLANIPRYVAKCFMYSTVLVNKRNSAIKILNFGIFKLSNDTALCRPSDIDNSKRYVEGLARGYKIINAKLLLGKMAYWLLYFHM